MVIKRKIAASIRNMLSKYPVIALTGPRQAGKTTVLKNAFADYRYINLENPDNRHFAESDPNAFLAQFSSKVILDEVQRVPSLFSYIQTLVDESGTMGQFILSGSQNFHLMEKITQSLAGRVAILKLFPFDHSELKKENLLNEDYLYNSIKGYYPAIYDRNIPSRTFYSNYIQTYLLRDVSELVSIRNMRAFKRFIALCATRAGQLLNLNNIANECDITQPTAKSWLSALEHSYIVFTLNPYYKNFKKRIVKTPKLYFYDTGLLCHLLKIHSSEQVHTHPLKGILFENMMIAEYHKQMYHNDTFHDTWFWRDSGGHEVDFITDETNHLKAYELKSTQTIMSDLFKGLLFFENIAKDERIEKYLVYGGNQEQKRSVANIVPWNKFGNL
ncbi:ATP-binding protein [Carboxylicivirga sp. N1Y90]|uniref:ATP-binding protein n=1 Tax=Carboxylicivirga fragile TaxID=3417571 RepID=UPI003D355E90|nr:ATP-binding protein [Marinilabiliaceae bacterium N1Y90]